MSGALRQDLCEEQYATVMGPNASVRAVSHPERQRLLLDLIRKEPGIGLQTMGQRLHVEPNALHTLQWALKQLRRQRLIRLQGIRRQACYFPIEAKSSAVRGRRSSAHK